VTWGLGPWGLGPWGGSTPPGTPGLLDASPYIVERRGGTVIRIVGSGFTDTMVVTVRQMDTHIGNGYIFDPRHDVRSTAAFVGMPTLPDGVYDLRVATDSGTVDLFSAIEARLHADQFRVLTNRNRWAPAWAVGARVLSG